MKARAGLVSLLVLVVASCSAPRIDTSSDETAAASMKRVRESLSEEDRTRFDEAVMVVAFSNMAEGNLFEMAAMASATPETMKAQMMSPLEGKTGLEVIAESDRITAEREAKERAQALEEIKELEEQKAKAAADAEELSTFEVLRSRFRTSTNRLGMAEPVIELTVKNGTDHPVARAYFLGTIASPGRAVPWLKEDFNYAIRGGLEPGETAKWSLTPNMFSAWGKVEAPKDAVFTVEVVKLDGPDDETLFDAAAFGDDQQERLEALQKEYGSGEGS